MSVVHTEFDTKESQQPDDETVVEIRKPFVPHGVSTGFLASLEKLPLRKYIIKKWMQRGYITGVYAPGGVGKSIFTIVMAISIASGKNLLGLGIKERTNVLILNNEDENDELVRRIGAIMTHYGVTDADVKGRLHYISGYSNPHVLARKVERKTLITSVTTVEATEKAREIIEFCKVKKIGAIFCDPLISMHEVRENDNDEMDKVISVMRYICHETGAAMCVSHHIRKGNDDSESHAGNVDWGRGAGGVKDAFRYVWTLAKMNAKTANSLGIEKERSRMIRVDSGKENFNLPDDKATWFRLESQQIANGEWVGVPVSKNLAPLFESLNNKKKKWKPISVAEAVERLMRGKPEKLSTSIRSKFMSENDVKERQAQNCIQILSDDEEEPTRIELSSGVLVDYWISKSHEKAPWTIHRREVSD